MDNDDVMVTALGTEINKHDYIALLALADYLEDTKDPRASGLRRVIKEGIFPSLTDSYPHKKEWYWPFVHSSERHFWLSLTSIQRERVSRLGWFMDRYKAYLALAEALVE